jgi:hypothetical protein
MLARLRSHRPSHTTIVAYLALFLAVGGTTYAAATIGPGDIKDNAVRSNHIKDGEVKNQDLGANSIGSGKVVDGSLLAQDFHADEGWHAVQSICGFSGFCGRWDNRPPDQDYNTVGYYRDRAGIVHLKGLARCSPPINTSCNGTHIFLLPQAWQPEHRYVFTTATGVGTGRIDITVGCGSVLYYGDGNPGWVSLDNISFRAAAPALPNCG